MRRGFKLKALHQSENDADDADLASISSSDSWIRIADSQIDMASAAGKSNLRSKQAFKQNIIECKASRINLERDNPKISRPSMVLRYAIRRSYQPQKSWLKSKWWPKLRPEATRLQWTCDCGVVLYEDYATTDPDVIARLSDLLSEQSSASEATGGLRDLQSPSPQRTTSGSGRNSATKSCKNSSSGEESLCQGCSGLQCSQFVNSLSKKSIALCINTGRFHTTLGEIDVTTISRDSEVFRMIKDCYLEVRGFLARARRLFLFKPECVQFVKMNVEDTFRADIVEKPSIPPREEVLARRYDYSPLDLPLPPITSNSFLHYLENPDCESLKKMSRWLSCLPKRLEEQLLSRRRCSEPNFVVTGWGIFIDEGLNEEALACVALTILVCSGLFGLTYSVKMGDVSGGFTVAGYMATVLGVGISILCLRWRQE